MLFAVNSSLHSYLIVSYAREDGVSLDVGFYYMSNALGRLLGTLLSGWVFQAHGLAACLWVSTAFVLLAALISWACRGITNGPEACAASHRYEKRNERLSSLIDDLSVTSLLCAPQSGKPVESP